MTWIRFCRIGIYALVAHLIGVGQASAHVSEQAIVLLLPTGIYIAGGCLAVIFSMLVLTIAPHSLIFGLFKPINFLNATRVTLPDRAILKDFTSLVSLCVVIFLVIIGFVGPRDPLANLLTLSLWTFWWILIFLLHVAFGNLWAWINPWTGLYNRIFRSLKSPLPLPARLGCWPAIALYIAFFMFMIADIAPDDPARLANVILGYMILTFVGMILCGGDRWLDQVECFSILFRFVGQLSPFGFDNGIARKQDKAGRRLALGLPGWKALHGEQPSLSQAFFILTMLACGSFDGLNETFWWLVKIGVNPLEFPGRSAVVMQSSCGLIMANLLLYAIFALCIWTGLKLAGYQGLPIQSQGALRARLVSLFSCLSVSLLPIAVTYHGSHFLTSLMLNSQYLVAALSDPFDIGSNYLGLENYQVTTGYLNQISSVRKIWLSQACFVVIGHIIGVLMAYFAISKRFASHRQAIAFHIPVAVFMALYTWFGLWLLASPKGV